MRRTDPTSGGNLPVELTSFVGRRRELREVKRLLGAARLVTLTGTGGTGKTRLAARAAAELHRAFSHGAWFVDLTGLRSPELRTAEVQDLEALAYQVMGALGLRDQPGTASPVEQLVRYLADRQTLLVLDNCEHLLPASAVLADTLLRGCPRLRILATSRELLLLAGEALFAVPPLPVPAPGARTRPAEVESCESVALFAARAQAVAPGFALTEESATVVGELCRRLDGLPLAIELAAARVRVLAPEQILELLTGRFDLLSRGNRDAPRRQQTLRASVEWSFGLCTEPEQLLWARVSVFVGGFELDAVEGICADELLPADELLEVVAALVDKSILVRDDAGSVTARYRLLETLRDYGQEQLTKLGVRDSLRDRHRNWYTDLARRFEADLISPRQPDWFARLDRELPNVRAALQYSLADPDGAEAALMAAGTLNYWTARGLPREGLGWVNRALARPGGPTLSRVKALFVKVALASLQGDFAAGSGGARQAAEIAAGLGDPLAHAIAACAEGYAALGRGEPADAVRDWQRGADALAVEADEYVPWRVSALAGLAFAKGMIGDVRGAAASNEAMLATCEPRGEYLFSGISLCSLGIGLWRRGELDAATVRFQGALGRLRRVNDTLCASWCLDALAWIAFDEGRPERAATLLGAVERLAQFMGAPAGVFPDMAAYHDRYEQRTRGALGERAYQAAVVRAGQMSLDEAVAYALDAPAQPAAPKPPAPATPSPLTRREQQVAELIAQGLSNKQLAASLVISQRTAESHVEHILSKLGCTNRAQVAAWMAALSSPGSDQASAG